MWRWNHRRVRSWIQAISLAAFVLPGTARAQADVEVKDELLRQFNASMRKIVALANAMPADAYTWSPGEGVMEVGQVYMHIARYNYLYPTQSLHMTLPEGIEMDQMESMRDKDQVLAALGSSGEWVRESVGAMTAAELEQDTQLYGRDVPKWAVLVQLVAHMNEHAGQSIAYARMNGVVPPWSR
jgi:uncharacterized damage-inducible protein DinB